MNMSPKGLDEAMPLEFTFDFHASGESTIRFPVEDGGMPPLSQVRPHLYKKRATKYVPN